MELIDVNEIKATKKVKQLILDLQIKLLSTEDALEDVARAAEIAEISGQFEVMNTFVRQANEVLADRIVRPDSSVKAGDYKMTVITNDEEDKKDAA